jgi:nicotinamidase-related amidase
MWRSTRTSKHLAKPTPRLSALLQDVSRLVRRQGKAEFSRYVPIVDRFLSGGVLILIRAIHSREFLAGWPRFCHIHLASDRLHGRLREMKTNKKRDPDRLNHAPDSSDVALLLIDVINDLEFVGGEKLLVHAMPMAAALAGLKERAKAAGIPAIYANDNFGRWRSDFTKLVHHCLENDVRGKPIVAKLAPEEDDYFVLKPKHSAFFHTNMDILLKYLGVRKIILTGLAGDICVLFSANDAYMRDFEIIVPPDCTASEDAEENQRVLLLMQRVLKAELTPATKITFSPRGHRRKKPRRPNGPGKWRES